MIRAVTSPLTLWQYLFTRGPYLMPSSIQLTPGVEARLDQLASATGRTKAQLLRELIETNLDRLESEYQLAQKAADVRSGHRDTVTSSELRHELNLDG
ncbi:type II toxin-antitoxin system RelB family antitoxin [Arthrobacter sp. TMT4-20]